MAVNLIILSTNWTDCFPTWQVVEKELLIQEKEKLYVELKQILQRQPGPEVAEQLQIYQQTLKEKTKQMKVGRRQGRQERLGHHAPLPSTIPPEHGIRAEHVRVTGCRAPHGH